MGAVGHRRCRCERDRGDVRVLRVSDRQRRQGLDRWCSARELAGARAGDRGFDHRRAGAGDRRVGRASTAAARRTGRADRHGGGTGERHEPDPRPPRVPVSGVGVARCCCSVRRSGQRSVQRDAAPALDATELRADLRLRLGGGICRQRRVVAGRVLRLYRRQGPHPRVSAAARRRRHERPDGDADRCRVVRGVRDAASADRTSTAVTGRGRRSRAGCAGWLPQALVGPRRRVAPRPQSGLLPDRQRGLSRRPGGRVHVRRRARR